MTPTNQKPREWWARIFKLSDRAEPEFTHFGEDLIEYAKEHDVNWSYFKVVPKEELDRVSKERDEAIRHAAIHNEQMHKAERERDQHLETIQAMSEAAKKRAVLDAEAFRSSYAKIQDLTARVAELESWHEHSASVIAKLTAENEKLKRELAELKKDTWFENFKNQYETIKRLEVELDARAGNLGHAVLLGTPESECKNILAESIAKQRDEARSEVERLKAATHNPTAYPTAMSYAEKLEAELAAQKERAEKAEADAKVTLLGANKFRDERDRALRAVEYAKGWFTDDLFEDGLAANIIAEIERLLTVDSGAESGKTGG